MAYDYNLLVIGAGSAGLAAAKRATKYGAKVTIVEQEHLGGVCVNRGCIPKKLMVYAADVAHCIEAAHHYGWSIEQAQFDWHRFITARNQEIERLRQVQQHALDQARVDLVRGHASFVDAHTIQVDDRQLTADYVLIAVGGKPNKPPIPGIEYTLTSREMFHLQELPARIAIIGGGYIGVEFASTLRSFGAEVFLMNQEECILINFDHDLRNAVREGLQNRGIHSFCSTTAKEIQPNSNGLQLTLTGEHSESLTVDMVLCATGRTPNLEALNLDKAGVAVQQKAIAVDDYNRTSQTHIFAIGDCTNRLPLTPVVRAEGQAFADTVFGEQPCKIDYETVPSAVFSRPEAASVGMTESQACEKYGDDRIECNRIEFQPLFDRLSPSSQPTLMKQVIQRASGQVIGVHIVAKHAAEIIQGIALAMKQGITKQDLHHMIGVHPTLAEEFFE